MDGGAGTVRRRGPLLVAVAGWLLVAAGVVTFWSANQAGWTAYTASYQPLQPGESLPVVFFGDGWTVMWTGTHLVGAALVVLGLLVLAALAGWSIGRRQGSSPTS
jgi:hypothetical protein